MLEQLMRKFVRWIDPKLEKYRTRGEGKRSGRRESSAFDKEKRAENESAFRAKNEIAPQTLNEFVEIVKRTPTRVLSKKDRARIAAIMSFDERTVGDIMVPKRKMVFVKDVEIMGPLMLDKLYKSGFTNFPVVDYNDKVLGVIHTEALNALEIKDTERATEYMDTEVNYLHEGDSLEFAISEIERTNSYYFLVLSNGGMLVGFFTVQMLLDYLLS